MTIRNSGGPDGFGDVVRRSFGGPLDPPGCGIPSCGIGEGDGEAAAVPGIESDSIGDRAPVFAREASVGAVTGGPKRAVGVLDIAR